MVSSSQLRAWFARRLSDLYGAEVPAYMTLLKVCHEVNRDVLAEQGSQAQRLGSIDRVTAERHGAIRVGSPAELRDVARVFGAIGMHPTGFYDLREAQPAPIPVVSTAFRPTDRQELARNPFRVFVSMLVPQDRRFFDEELEGRLHRFLDARQLFPEELLALADEAEDAGELGTEHAERFLDLATTSFALSAEPVARVWYGELERVSSVAADIGGVPSTHINHLTPRVLDIDELYRRMQARGITMIDRIQGPPRWDGPDVLLRQTSFRALAEPRRFREPDATITTGQLRVRFGEVEQRGVALTPPGRQRYDQAVAEVGQHDDIAAQVWKRHFPSSEVELARQDLAFYTFRVADRPRDGRRPSADLTALLDHGWVVPEPIVYEDFLPASAAGIFSSNLTSQGRVDASRDSAPRDIGWLTEALGRPVNDPMALYAAQRAESLRAVAQVLDLPAVPLPPIQAMRSAT